MQLFCVGDVAFDVDIPPWFPPGVITPGDKERIIFNCELPFWKTINPIPRTSGPRILSHPNSINVIKKWAPGFASLATNHILDGGEGGLANTLDALNREGFQTVGAGFSEEEIIKPLIWETTEGRLAMVNWVFPETHPEWNAVPGPNYWPGIEEAMKIIRYLKYEADWLLALVHWSDELFPYPRPEDRVIAKQLVDAGADMIVGHHPHVVRGLEMIDGKPVFYSLGNFYFPEIQANPGYPIIKLAPRNKEALLVSVTFRRGLTPGFDVISYWQGGIETKPDPYHRAEARMRQTSKPLAKFTRTEYSRWYFHRRRFFDPWEYRIVFSLRQKGWKESFYYLFTALSRILKSSKKQIFK